VCCGCEAERWLCGVISSGPQLVIYWEKNVEFVGTDFTLTHQSWRIPSVLHTPVSHFMWPTICVHWHGRNLLNTIQNAFSAT